MVRTADRSRPFRRRSSPSASVAAGVSNVGITGALPVTIITTIVSPITRPIPSITPAIIPDEAAGSMIRHNVCHRVAPRPKAASRYAPRHADQGIFGNADDRRQRHKRQQQTAGQAAHAGRKMKRVLRNGPSQTIPINPKTTLGIEASISISDLRTCLQRFGRNLGDEHRRRNADRHANHYRADRHIERAEQKRHNPELRRLRNRQPVAAEKKLARANSRRKKRSASLKQKQENQKHK